MLIRNREKKRATYNESRSKKESIPAIDQFISWWTASNSCFLVLREVDKTTITDDKPTKVIYFQYNKYVNFISLEMIVFKGCSTEVKKDYSYLQVKEHRELRSTCVISTKTKPIFIIFGMKIQMPSNSSNYHGDNSTSDAIQAEDSIIKRTHLSLYGNHSNSLSNYPEIYTRLPTSIEISASSPKVSDNYVRVRRDSHIKPKLHIGLVI